MKFVALEKVVDIKGGGTPDKSVSSYWNGDIPWASVKDFKSLEINKTVDTITKKGVANSATNIIPAGTVIVPTRMAVGKAAINKMDLAINQDLKALIPCSEVYNRYLLYFMLANSHELERQATGATVKGIKLDALRSLKFPLLKLDEQKRIAAILDQADELRRARRKSIDRLNDLSQAIFYEMFSEDLLNGGNVPLGNLVREFRYGTSEKSQSEGYPTLRIPNIVGGDINISDLKYVPVSDPDYKRLKLEDGDLLFVRTNGNPDYVGRCAVFDSEALNSKKEWIYASYLIRARLDLAKINPAFLQNFLSMPAGRKALRDRCKTSAGQYNINTEGLGSIPVPVCDIKKQHEYAKRVQNINKIKKVYVMHVDEIDHLFSSLQQKAFSGAL